MFEKRGRIENEVLLDIVRLSPCLVCMRIPCDPHHVTTVKAGGGDTEDNVMPLCRRHHSQWHQSGVAFMIDKYPTILSWLVYHDREDVIARSKRTTKGC